MKAAVQTIETLRSTLQTGLLSPAVESAATQYARLCTQAEERLEMIAAMLAKGSDYQALQTAEQEPPLLDLVAVLSFGGEKAWQDFCQAHQLPMAPRLDAKTVQALDRLYTQGITANHPLYKDFRAAVLSREDAKALRIVRTILKLNPADENARSELLRLENKHFQDTLEQLRAALKTDDEERISRLAEQLAHAAPEEKLKGLPEYQQADGIRRHLRRRQAEERLPGLLEQGWTHQGAGDWRAAAVVVETVDDLVQTHGIELPPGTLQTAVAELGAYVRRERLGAEKRRGFEQALSSFSSFAEEIETRLLTGGGLGRQEVLQQDESFVRRWRELESFQMAVPNEVLQRLRRVGQELRSRLEQQQRGRRARLMMGAAAALLLLLGIAGVAWHGWQARTFALDLESYRARRVSEPAEKLAASLRAGDPLLLRWPFLRTKVEEAEVWTRQAKDLTAQVEKTLLDLESSAGAGFPNTEPAALSRQMDDLRALLGQLPGDLAAARQSRFTALRTKADLAMAEAQQQHSGKARETVAGLTTLIEKDLTYERPAAEVAAAVKKAEAMLAGLETWLKPEAGPLQLSADLDARVKAARQRVDGFKRELERFEEVREKTAAAETLAAYKTALAAWQDIRFVESAPAAGALTTLPAEEQFLADLLTQGDLPVWKAVVEDASGSQMAPDIPAEEDLKILLMLRDDRDLNGVWENNVTDYSRGQAQRTVWSRGRLNEASAGDSLRRWNGPVYDPRPEDISAVFVETEFRRIAAGGGHQGQAVGGSQLSKTSQFMDELQLNRMTDANGERYQKPLLEVFDRIVADKQASPVARAYVMLELDRLARRQPHAWGFHLCPSLRADLAELRTVTSTLPLRGEDWMLAKIRAQVGAPLAQFFTARAGRAYTKEAQALRQLLRQASFAGLKFGGYVEADLRLRLTNDGRGARDLWVLARQGGKPLHVPNPAAQAAAGTESARPTAAGAHPLSPVFFIPVDRQAAIQQLQQALAGATSAPQALQSLFLTAP